MSSSSSSREGSARGAPAPLLVPSLLIAHGRVMLPGENGPEIARDRSGAPLDIFDVADFLSQKYSRLYVVDLDGIEENRPQLDFLQEIAREADAWIDAGPRTADQAIDILITGARRAVLSTAYLGSEKELRKAWKLSPDLALEVEVRGAAAVARAPEWSGQPAEAVARASRAIGVSDVVLSYRERAVDWTAVRAVAGEGPTWVDGTFELSDSGRLSSAGAAGGIFHIHESLRSFVASPEGAETDGDATPLRSSARHDDEKRTS